MVKGEFPASLTIVMDPVSLPAAFGENDAVRTTLSDGESVAGAATPLIVRPAPTAVALEILTAALPAFVTTICFSVELPVATFPKLRSPGFALSWPVATMVPLPLRGTTSVGFAGSLLVMTKLPVVLPAAVGEKVATALID